MGQERRLAADEQTESVFWPKTACPASKHLPAKSTGTKWYQRLAG